MDRIEVCSTGKFSGEIVPPPDKSISHRAVIFSSLAQGTGRVKNFLRAQDTESTLNAFRALGITIEEVFPSGAGQQTAWCDLVIHGKGLHGLREPFDVIHCGNSGTTIRLLSGVLAGNPFFSVLTGDDSLKQRPMARVIRPLSMMGAEITARDNNKFPPLAIKGRSPIPLQYTMPMSSAQVKSSILLAGLYGDGKTVITEPSKSRDHTEKMLPAYGADLTVDGLTVSVQGGRELSAMDMEVPGDFSSAAFFLVAALIIPGAEVVIKNVCLNPTRTGLLNVLGRMGAEVRITDMQTVSGETAGTIHAAGKGRLKAVEVSGEIIPSLIDEFPILCVAAAAADGTTTIRDAGELRVKESDRIQAMAAELRKLGVAVEEYPDGIAVTGSESLHGAAVDSHGDHRIAMSMAVAGLIARGKTVIHRSSSVDISFPGFFSILARLSS